MTYQLYTSEQILDSTEHCMVVLDITEKDFRSNPSLDRYIQYWFIDVDDLIDFILTGTYTKITLIISPLLINITFDILRPLFPQIIRIIIIGNGSFCGNHAEHYKHAQALVDNIHNNIRQQRRLYITFE
ncbi:unnamed protein product, partial [Rotaria magnacalcarata]